MSNERASPKILIVDDEHALADLIKAILNRKGNIDIANNGEEALTMREMDEDTEEVTETYQLLYNYMLEHPQSSALFFPAGAISNYVTNLRDVTIAVTGKDLMERGLKPGPVYREIMAAVMQARLNKRLETRRDELKFVDEYLASKKAGTKTA